MSKTDEERVENIPSVLMDKTEWIATEKLDGTSTTATVRRGKFGKFDYYICSRNVVFDKPGKNCFYEKNVYTMMSEKYQFEKVLIDLCKKYNLDALHDTIHEMARDEARHGKAFEGLLKRYFGK